MLFIYLSCVKYYWLLIFDVVIVRPLFMFNIKTNMKHLCDKECLIYHNQTILQRNVE